MMLGCCSLLLAALYLWQWRLHKVLPPTFIPLFQPLLTRVALPLFPSTLRFNGPSIHRAIAHRCLSIHSQQRLQLKQRGEYTEKLDLEELLTQVGLGNYPASVSLLGVAFMCYTHV
jgi:hypothetical protein